MDWVESTPMKTIRSIIMILMSGYCLLMAAAPTKIIPIQMTPEALHEQASELNRRVGALESMNLEHRLTSLEGQVDAMSLQTRGTIGGIGVLLIEGVIRLSRKKKEEES